MTHLQPQGDQEAPRSGRGDKGAIVGPAPLELLLQGMLFIKVSDNTSFGI